MAKKKSDAGEVLAAANGKLAALETERDTLLSGVEDIEGTEQQRREEMTSLQAVAVRRPGTKTEAAAEKSETVFYDLARKADRSRAAALAVESDIEVAREEVAAAEIVLAEEQWIANREAVREAAREMDKLVAALVEQYDIVLVGNKEDERLRKITGKRGDSFRRPHGVVPAVEHHMRWALNRRYGSLGGAKGPELVEVVG